MHPPTTRPLVGLLPAAGRGTRLEPYRSPKELLPLMLRHGPDGTEAIPTPVCHLVLRSMRQAGAQRCVVVISNDKQEIPRTLGSGAEVGLTLAYVHQAEPRGLTDVVRCAQPWLEGADVVFGMPDTVVLPDDAVQRLHQRRLEQGADVMLGVFPTDEPERLAPVDVAEGGHVRGVHDKPGHRRWLNTWGVLAWGPAFTSFCCEWERERAAAGRGHEGVISHAMEAARGAGLCVRALEFPAGVFVDLGTPRGLAASLRVLARRGLLAGMEP